MAETSNADLNASNVRNHGTLRERPVDRFEREREYLIPLAPWPYHSNVVPVPPPAPSLPAANWPRMVDVERRPLTELFPPPSAAQLADLKMPGALEALDGVLSGVEGTTA